MRLAAWALGALLATAPIFSQTLPAADPQLKDGELIWFLLTETREAVARSLGQPTMAADFGGDFHSWQYQVGDVDHDDFSLHVVFRKSARTLISVTRNYESGQNVDALFPKNETTVHHFPDAKKPQFSLRLRRLSGGRVLMAMGTSKAGDPTSQLVLMRETELRYFYPWLLEQLRAESSRR
jgi:hypothetical protein